MPRGGKRVGSGRPRGDRTVLISVRVSPEAAQYLADQPNKSEFVDWLLMYYKDVVSRVVKRFQH